MTNKLSSKTIQAFQKEILEWYKLHQRDLPWRRDRDPYHILISEIMLQQTQVQRVIPKYEAWLEAFPTLESLAEASTRDVLLNWSGLGYNRRALFLQKLAQNLVHSYSFTVHGKKQIMWPRTEKELRQLPGIGEYTARALLCFAFDEQVAVVDTNIRKVILVKFFDSRFSGISFQKKSLSVVSMPVSQQKNRKLINNIPTTDNREQITDKEIQEIADQLLPQGKAYEWNQALMDYSALVVSRDKNSIHLLRQGFEGQAKQSKFKDSNRYFRGQILKRLLEVHTQTKKDFLEFFEAKNIPLENTRLTAILQTLEKDNFITIKNQEISLT